MNIFRIILMTVLCVAIVVVPIMLLENEPDVPVMEKSVYKPVNIDSIANVQHVNFLKWMNLEFYALGKQQEFKGKMDLSEVRYQVNGKKQDYRSFYKYRDSLIKWIKFKDSLDKTQK